MSVKRPITALFAFLLAIAAPSANEQDTIIPELNPSIQLIYTRLFSSWPGVSGISPVEVSVDDERIRLIWPGSIISLRIDGAMDEQTLLTLFATQTADWGNRNWTPENGVVCSDGFWRGFIPEGEVLARLNLKTGSVDSAPWPVETPDSIYPAYDGNLLVFSRGKPGLIRISGIPEKTDYQPLETEIPRLSQLAVSTDLPLAAWKESTGDAIYVADLSGGGIAGFYPESLPGKPVRAMDWAGDKLVLAYAGELVILAPPGTEQMPPVRIADSRLPDRWYKVRGGSDRLVIQLPETGILGIMTSGNLSEPVAPELQKDRPVTADFPGLLEFCTLSAGDVLEETGHYREAEIYYRWVLPYIRENRSLHPLDEIWPALESELTTRRLKLRNRIN